MSSILARLRNQPCLVVGLVCAWKVALLLVSAQPVPANDAFFYDGAVVHQLQHGGYYNPSLALALPISGTQLFSAYPPLYQALLWLWMSCFGTSVIAAMALHLVLFIAYVVVLCLILRRLQVPAWCFHFAGAFLLSMTFHDRPDSLAHVLGMLAVYSFIRARRSFGGDAAASTGGLWLGCLVGFSVLTLATSLQIGGIYWLLLWLGIGVTTLAGGERFPVVPMAAMVVVPAALVALVRFGLPGCWRGFVEHAAQTPSFTGLRLPHPPDLLKIARYAPGIILVAAMLPWTWFKQHNDVAPGRYARLELLLLPALLAALAVVGACLIVLTPNTVAIANYLQPLIVAAYLAFCAAIFTGGRWLRLQIWVLALAAGLGSIRAIGMTTWGLACAADVGYPTAIRQVDAELSALPAGAKVVLSSAYLYEASRRDNLTLIHSDWLMPAKPILADSDLRGLVAQKPALLVLTQFDYYRRYQPVLAALRDRPELIDERVENAAHICPPDAYPRLKLIVQHISWAPVVVKLQWRAETQR